MTKDTKVIGRVYMHLTDNIDKYFSRTPRLYKYDQLKGALQKAGKDEYAATSDFPIEFFEEMCEVVLDWCWNKFEGVSKDEIKPIYTEAWKFHKKYMNASTDAEWDEMIKAANSIAGAGGDAYSKENRYYVGIYIAIMHHIEAINKDTVETAQPTVA